MPHSNSKDWIFYEDGAVEPVRKDQSIYLKQRGKGIPDWYVDRKPTSWNPSDEGLSFTTNHRSKDAPRPTPNRGKIGGTLITGHVPTVTAENTGFSGGIHGSRKTSAKRNGPSSNHSYAIAQKIYNKNRNEEFESFLYSGQARVGKALSNLTSRAPQAIGKAFSRTYDELTSNEDIHNGLKFGVGAAWDVTQEVGKEVGSKVAGAISEQLALDRISHLKHGRKLKDILSKPSVQSARTAYDLGRQVADGVSEYEEMAKRISQKVSNRRKDVYGE